MSTDSKTPVTNAAVRIADYLFSGGLFNPELATHDNVRDLLLDCRTELIAANARLDWLERHQMIWWTDFKYQMLQDKFGLRAAIDEAMKGTTT